MKKQKVRRFRGQEGLGLTIVSPRFYDTIFSLLGKLYLVQDARCIRFPVTDISALRRPDNGFPKDLITVFRNLPGEFKGPPDEVFKIKRSSGWKVYYLKGSSYVRYDVSRDGEIAGTLSPVQDIPAKWGLSDSKYEGIRSDFDMVTVGKDASGGQRLWATKGSRYLQYKKATYAKPDAGFPKEFDGFWGVLPAGFKQGFDSAMVSESNQLYAFSGGEYVKYPDPLSSEFEGPRPLANLVWPSEDGRQTGISYRSYLVDELWGNLPNDVKEGDAIRVREFVLGTSLGFYSFDFFKAETDRRTRSFVTYAYDRSRMPDYVEAMYHGGDFSFRFYVEDRARKLRCLVLRGGGV